MMVTLGIYMRRGHRLLRRWAANPKIHALLQGGGYFFAGFLSSAASLGHWLQPIALGILCAQTGWSALLLSAGSAIGYLLFWGNQGPIGVVWSGAGLVVALVLNRHHVIRKVPLLIPAISALIVAATGLLFQYYHLAAPPIFIYILQILLAAGTTGVFCVATERQNPIVQWLISGLAVLCLAQIVPLPYLGLGYVAAGALAMTGAFPVAALAGLALDLAQVTPTPMGAVLCLSYLVRLLPRLHPAAKHFVSPMAYLLVMSICGTHDWMPLPGLFLGSMGALLLPKQTAIPHRRGDTGTAQVHLELASAVLRQMENIILDIQDAPIDEQALIFRAADRACSSCPCRKTCKEHPEQIPSAILHRPLGNGADLPGNCRKSGRLLMEMRRSQEQLRAIRADRDRQLEYRAAVGQQYGFLSDYLQDISDTLAQRSTTMQAWFRPEVVSRSTSQNKESGDRCIWFSGISCRYYVLLCDGMGTGEEAAQDAARVSSMLRRLLCSGYPAAYALRSINSLCALQGRAGAVTLDLAELRLDTGKVTLYKWGAAPSYVFSQGEPIKIGTVTPPPGLSVTDGHETVERLSLRRGETLVLLSDGARGEESLRRIWMDEYTTSGELAVKILQSSPSGNTDDATVAVVRLHTIGAST